MSVPTLDEISLDRVLIRRAQPDDAERLIAFAKELAAEPGIHLPFTADEADISVDKELESIERHYRSNSVYLVAELNGFDHDGERDEEKDIVGELSCTGDTYQCTEHVAVLGMNVHKNWRNKGLGSTLMERAIAWARQTQQISRIELEVYASNKPAIHLYEKFGFEIEGRKRQAINQWGCFHDMLVMSLLL